MPSHPFVERRRTPERRLAEQQAQHRVTLALRSGQIGVWDWDVPSGAITWNDQMYELYGLEPGGDVRYETWSGAVLPEDLPAAEANLQKAIDLKQATENLFRIRLLDGRVRHIAASQEVVVDETGEVARVIGVNRDVTALREAEARLRASEEKMRLSFRHSAVGSAIVSLEGRFDEVNDALGSMVGYTAAEMSQLTFQAITHPDDLQKDLDLVTHLMAGRIHSYHLEKRYLHKAGHTVWVRISVALARDEQGAPQHFIVQVEDVSARRTAQDVAARAQRDLESFSYSVAHDLRAPLRAISGFSRLLARRPPVAADEAALELIGQVNEGAARMGVLIDDLLGLSSVERRDFRRECVDLSAMARQVLAELAHADEPREVELRVEDGLLVDADPSLLRIVLDNLLGNAWKYTRHKPGARIEVGAIGAGPGRRYFVRDNGVGFDMAYVAKLFQPFQRLHSPKDFEGTGIGLATVLRAIDRHGGEVSGEGRVGEGATFTFTFGQA